MREIIFRGKRKDNGHWVTGGFLIVDNDDDENGGTQYIIAPHGKEFYRGSIGGFYFVIPETIGQYTGLTDKKGKKIFEGDIVKFIHKGKWKKSEISPFGVEVGEPYSRNYKIEYVNTFARYGLRFINGSIHFPCKQSTLLMYDCEVIGNIHDKPELLEEGK